MHESIDTIDFEQISAFVAVAETKSFVQAAQRLGKDASVLSRRVSQLEAQLGARLLQRTTRRITLTEVGLTYYGRVHGLLDALRSANLEASDAVAVPRGLLRITLPVAYGRLCIAPLIPGFMAQYPQIRLDVRFTDRFADLVAEGFDLAIRLGTMRDSSLIARKLTEYRTRLVAAPQYLQQRGVPTTVSELREHDCLGFTSHASWPDWHIPRAGKHHSISPQGPLVSDNSEFLLMAAIQGHGIAWVPDWLAMPALDDGRLQEVLANPNSKPEGGVYIVRPPGALVPAKTRAMVDMLVAAFHPD